MESPAAHGRTIEVRQVSVSHHTSTPRVPKAGLPATEPRVVGTRVLQGRPMRRGAGPHRERKGGFFTSAPPLRPPLSHACRPWRTDGKGRPWPCASRAALSCTQPPRSSSDRGPWRRVQGARDDSGRSGTCGNLRSDSSSQDQTSTTLMACTFASTQQHNLREKPPGTIFTCSTKARRATGCSASHLHPKTGDTKPWET